MCIIGVDFSERYFDQAFLWCSNRSSTYRQVFQQMNRFRYYNDGKVHVHMNLARYKQNNYPVEMVALAQQVQAKLSNMHTRADCLLRQQLNPSTRRMELVNDILTQLYLRVLKDLNDSKVNFAALLFCSMRAAGGCIQQYMKPITVTMALSVLKDTAFGKQDALEAEMQEFVDARMDKLKDVNSLEAIESDIAMGRATKQEKLVKEKHQMMVLYQVDEDEASKPEFVKKYRSPHRQQQYKNLQYFLDAGAQAGLRTVLQQIEQRTASKEEHELHELNWYQNMQESHDILIVNKWVDNNGNPSVLSKHVVEFSTRAVAQWIQQFTSTSPTGPLTQLVRIDAFTRYENGIFVPNSHRLIITDADEMKNRIIAITRGILTHNLGVKLTPNCKSRKRRNGDNSMSYHLDLTHWQPLIDRILLRRSTLRDRINDSHPSIPE